MTYKMWIKRFYFGFSFVAFIALLITYFVHDKYTYNQLKSKEYLLKDNTPKIIFAGDSRAERQLNPIVAKKILSLNNGDIINIAISSGDSLIINEIADKYPKKFKNSILIISISANQLNDNAKKPAYFAYSIISKFSYLEQIKIFRNDPMTLLASYKHNLKQFIKQKFHYNHTINAFPETYGFNGISSKLTTNDIALSKELLNPWYINYKDGKIKYQYIEHSLIELSHKVKALYIYTAPFPPSYLKIVKKSVLYTDELLFKKSIKKICLNNNITYKNYMQLDHLEDKHFYDTAHLNISGANIFTEIILKDFHIIAH